MTSTNSAAGFGPAADDAESGPLDDIAGGVVQLSHSFNRVRAQVVAQAEHDIEWSANMLILHLVQGAPMRSSALAELVHLDPSSVSRTVAALVADGMIERVPDPSDGRATLLVPTDKTFAVIYEHRDIRRNHFARILEHWSAAEIRAFSRLLGRFVTDFDDYRDGLDDADWLRAGGKPEVAHPHDREGAA
ncbi:MAG: transcriptional regulator, MarR family [Frankiales bacterium]|nr:transcriptional regulator, MarR family [Frankiales bacterium]